MWFKTFLVAIVVVNLIAMYWMLSWDSRGSETVPRSVVIGLDQNRPLIKSMPISNPPIESPARSVTRRPSAKEASKSSYGEFNRTTARKSSRQKPSIPSISPRTSTPSFMKIITTLSPLSITKVSNKVRPKMDNFPRPSPKSPEISAGVQLSPNGTLASPSAARFIVSEEEYQKCMRMNDFNEEEMSNFRQLQETKSSVGRARFRTLQEKQDPQLKDVHQKVSVSIATQARVATCWSTRKYLLLGSPHFTGGRHQILRYLREHDWQDIGWTLSELLRNASAADLLPRDIILAISACSRVLPLSKLQQAARLISMAPGERKHTLKVAFLESVKALYGSTSCDYRDMYPESYLVDSVKRCLDLRTLITTEISNNGSTKHAVWFLKVAVESFGEGITVRTAQECVENELANCELFDPKVKDHKRILFQRKVENILTVNGRVTQGRVYLLISNYSPATAWFYMGYFNVAKVPLAGLGGGSELGTSESEDSEDQISDDKAKRSSDVNENGGDESFANPQNIHASSQVNLKAQHVTNLKSNQDSKRVLFEELMSDRSPDDQALARRNIKRSILMVFRAMKRRLGSPKGSFSLLGIDIVLQENMDVKVLETNCNCELFSNAAKFGEERVALSTALVDGMFDIVLAQHINPDGGDDFNQLLDDVVATRALGQEYGKGNGNSWELIYSDAVHPTFEYSDIFESCP